MKPNNITLFCDDKIDLLTKLKKPYGSKYLGKYYKNDNDDNFFKFIRSMVLAHSLKINCKKFSNFTHKKYAFTPIVRWNSEKNKVIITYYIPDFNIKTQTLSIEINDLFAYVESRYDYLDLIFPYIKIEKEKEKNRIKQLYYNDFQNIPTILDKKIELLKKVYYKNGDLDVKNKADVLSYYFDFIHDLISTNFTEDNIDKIILFKQIIDFCLDDIIESLKLQDNRNLLISEILKCYNYTNDTGKFIDSPYEINKIFNTYKFLVKNEFYFEEYYSKVINGVKCYFSLENISRIKEKVMLCIMAFGIDNLIHRDGLIFRFPKTIIEKVRKLYEIQI